MKLYRNAITLLAVVLLLGATYFVTNNKKNADNLESSSQSETIKVLNLNPDTIHEIVIEHQNERLVFLKKENKWMLTEPSNINYDQVLADGLPLSILYFTASKQITEKADDLAQYGLDNPSIISVKTSDGKSEILEIGKLTSSKDSYYFKNKDSDKIYIIDKTKVDSVLLTSNSIKDKNVLSLKRELQSRMLADDIVSIVMQKDGKLVLSARKNKEGDSWSLAAPEAGDLDKSKMTPVLNAISKVLALEFIDDNPANLDKYGLKSPKYSLEFENSTGRKKLLIGEEKVNGKEFYAKVEGENDVFSLNIAGFNFLDKPLQEFMQ